MRTHVTPLRIVKHLVLLVSSLVFMFPFLWMVFGVFKTNNEIWQQPYKLFPSHWNLVEVLQSLPTLGLGTYIYNSFFVGIVGTLIMLFAATLFTYVVVFMKTKHTELLFALVLATYMLPGAITYVPSYVILANAGLLDTLSGKKTSLDYIDAARIDGANHLRTLWHVVFPLNQSAFFTLFTLTFIQQYNNYMWPSIMLTSRDKYLISQGLRQFFIQEGAYGMNWAEVMLASTVATLPLFIIFIVGQNWLVTGIMQDSGLK